MPEPAFFELYADKGPIILESSIKNDTESLSPQDLDAFFEAKVLHLRVYNSTDKTISDLNITPPKISIQTLDEAAITKKQSLEHGECKSSPLW